nr:hypothetical protein [Enterococcus innesii]
MTQYQETPKDNHYEKKEKYAENFDRLDNKEKAIVYVLWSIHTKKLRIGSRLYFEPLKERFAISKGTWLLVKEFLSGANVLVDQVIIADKVEKPLLERFHIVNE